ncbi:MAG: drug/metabolite transporter (DMT)-like permease [Thalassomonas sp.]|jgi:drug/metabolite transporter (DMT)-like permease
MSNIIYTILLFNVLIIVFKMFEKYNVDNLQALIINYITAGVCSYLFLEQEISLDIVLNSDWIYHAIIIGTLFIIVFNFYAYGIQKVGIAVTTVANKMSLIIPVCAALILYPEENIFDTLKGIAFFLALAGIYLSSTKAGKLSFDKKYLWLILLVFIGQGLSDSIFNDFAQKFPNEGGYLFFMVLFFMATVSGILILTGKSFNKKNSLQLKSVFWGIVFGVPNFFSLVFFLKALGNMESSIVFPLVSMGVVVSSSLIGLFLFKEKLSKRNWIGILLSLCAIYIFSF